LSWYDEDQQDAAGNGRPSFPRLIALDNCERKVGKRSLVNSAIPTEVQAQGLPYAQEDEVPLLRMCLGTGEFAITLPTNQEMNARVWVEDTRKAVTAAAGGGVVRVGEEARHVPGLWEGVDRLGR